MCEDPAGGCKVCTEGKGSTRGVLSASSPPKGSNLPLAGRWQRLEEEESVFTPREMIWMQAGKCGRVWPIWLGCCSLL